MPRPTEYVLNRKWIQDLPKCELHLHLEGTVSPSTLVDLSQRHDAEPLSHRSAASLYNYSDFHGFLNAFREVSRRMKTATDYGLVASEMMRSLFGQGIRHAEVYVSYGDSIRYNPDLTIDDVMLALESARKKAESETGLTVYWVMDLVRTNGLKHSAFVFQEAIRLNKRFPSLIGIGIGGDEMNYPARLYAQIYQDALNAGLRVKAHAGEAAPASAIREAIRIGAQRIGHALTAIEDETVMQKLKQSQTPIEVCITSNLRTGCCKSLKDHPVGYYLQYGLNVNLGSDDPEMFGSNLADEYELVQREFGFTKEQLKSLARNSIESSFLDTSRKSALLQELKRHE